MKRKFILIGLLLSTFMSAIEGTVTGPAGPAIVSSFGGMQLMSWIFTAYLLTMAVTTPIFGKVSDIYGRKPVFIIGSIIFALGSLLCGFSQNMEQLIVFRAIQGIGAGAIVPVAFTIIGDIYPIEQRAKIQALISSVWGISSLIGPLIGGYLVDYWSWRWIFGFNVPFGLVSIVLIARYLPKHIVSRKARVDVAGALTFTVGVSALLFVMATGGQNFSWNSPVLIGCIIIAILCITLFFIVEKRAEEPMLPLKLFRIRDIAVSSVANLLIGALLIGLTTYTPLWIQGVLGKNATFSGLALAPMSVGWVLGSVAAGRMILTAGSRKTTLIGVGAIVISAFGMVMMTGETPDIVLLMITFIYGIGFGYTTTVFTLIAQSSVGYELRGSSTALNSFIRTLGQTIGVAAFGSWINLRMAALLNNTAGAENISPEDINKLLTPEESNHFSEPVWHMMHDVLEGSLHSLFIVMAVIAIMSMLVVTRFRKTKLYSDQ
ncbi:MDR family MFS transporter [Paenibacillus crassostreae]|uniref:Disulfide bond formation protein DsbA n=1 Tax=Paenibacillus crassostreae TaxID=1763538 RepID=A0A167AKE3_9BACL|nr:MDR family MFS transporter [Paenibacillus crassostreae]AOZ94636.1 MFS transporter [Paenibacillus crassostreae]OAB71131.1 disulfide bond formation protein DsbA [Paenibacillus crassostreae]